MSIARANRASRVSCFKGLTDSRTKFRRFAIEGIVGASMHLFTCHLILTETLEHYLAPVKTAQRARNDVFEFPYSAGRLFRI